MKVLIASALAACVVAESFDPLHHLGGNSPWFSGPQDTGISSDVPDGCSIDQAAFISRHGSRYPDPGAYSEWTNFTARIKASKFSTRASELKFLSSWTPPLPYPEEQIAKLSQTGYRELYNMGVDYRFRYGPTFFKDNTEFTLWANLYSPSPRVVDSARLFARGYMGPNSTFGNVYAINSSDPRSVANSLAASDICPLYKDSGGGVPFDTWQAIWRPPVQKRLNSLISGGFQLTEADISLIPYLCGFDTEITGERSPFCDIFSKDEIRQYEYAQDLRYWYGTGLGTDIEKDMMLPFLRALVQRFVDGPNATYTNSDGSTFKPNPLIATFSNDGQVNSLAAAIGVFDGEKDLPGDRIDKNRLFKSSNFCTMRGTISFERLNCKNNKYMRLRLNDVVYPVSGCQGGPGRSCPLDQYRKLVDAKIAKSGGFQKECNVTSGVVPVGQEKTTFLTDVKLPFEILYKP